MNVNTQCKRVEALSHSEKDHIIIYLLGLIFILASLSCGISGENRPPELNLEWTHLSAAQGDLAAPNSGPQQTASLILEIDKVGTNDFVITERTESPSVVWYRRGTDGWTRYVVDNEALRIEAGGAFHDIDDDGDPDVLFGEDSRGNKVYWWGNSNPNSEEIVDALLPDVPAGTAFL